MLKLTVSPGEFLMIGDDIKIVFCGGERSNIPIAIDAPREKNIVRSSAVDKGTFKDLDRQPRPYVEKSLSEEAKRKITAIVVEDRWRQSQGETEAVGGKRRSQRESTAAAQNRERQSRRKAAAQGR